MESNRSEERKQAAIGEERKANSEQRPDSSSMKDSCEE
jgi:hypothetical protein